MNFMEVLRTAVFALRGNWMRSALTSLGVIIGIAAVIVMVSVGQGTQAEIDKLVSGLGSNRLDISGGSGVGGGGVRLAAGSRYTLVGRRCGRDPQGNPGSAVRRCIAARRHPGRVRGEQLVDPMAGRAAGLVRHQRMEDRQRRQAVRCARLQRRVEVGDPRRHGAAQQLFGDQDPVGQTVRLGRVPFTVVGTLKPKGQGGFGQDQDDVVVVPLETARRRLSGATALPPGAVQQISLGVGRAEDLSYAQDEVEALLRQRHRIQPGDDDDFSVRNIAEVVATRTQTTRLMSLLLGAVAGISLIVGGIGIMNIMLVSVTERIREIGLRMAVGAGPGDIRKQFLAEAMLISMIGGVIGILLGVVGALLVARFGSLPVALNGKVVGVGRGVLDRDRSVLRLLPGAQGVAAGSDRGVAAAVAVFAGTLARMRLAVCWCHDVACWSAREPRAPPWSSTAAPASSSAAPCRARTSARSVAISIAHSMRATRCWARAARRWMRSRRRSRCWRIRRASTPAGARCSAPMAGMNSTPRSWKDTPGVPARWRA